MKHSIISFHQQYPDNDACLTHLFSIRFPNPKCDKCGRVGQFHKHPKQPCFTCNCGKTHIFPKQGTIFEHSSTDLVKWYFAIYLFAQSRNGVAAKEIERACEVTYKTAWRMAKEIRKLMTDMPTLQSGEVEADETVVGAPKRGKRGRGAEGKTIVFGTLQRKGKVQTAIVPNVKAVTLLPHFEDHVAKGTKLITDELKSYKKIAKIMDVEHKTVEHGAHQYAKPDGTHTNSIEGFWSQLKRSIHGTYHVVSPKYLSSYVSEFSWRYNNRLSEVSMFDLLICRADLRHVVAVSRIVALQGLL
jgi:transposase